MSKNFRITSVYCIYVAYIFIKSILFFKFNIKPTDYLNNFEGIRYHVFELLPFYLIILSIILETNNIYYSYRFKIRNNIVSNQYKKIIIYTTIFVLLNFFICIFLFNNKLDLLNIYPLQYYILLAITYILGYLLIGGMVLLVCQFNKLKTINSTIVIFLYVLIECFIVFGNIIPGNMPFIVSWMFADKSLLLRIIVLVIINNILYTMVHNKSLSREFI